LTYEEIIAAYTRKESEFGNQVSRWACMYHRRILAITVGIHSVTNGHYTATPRLVHLFCIGMHAWVGPDPEKRMEKMADFYILGLLPVVVLVLFCEHFLSVNTNDWFCIYSPTHHNYAH
jgi:hypothetical protein